MINDQVGMMMDFSSEGLAISFYRNKENLGVCYSKLPKGHYYPCVYMKFNESKITLLESVDYPDI